ncbi:MAG: hypothetical protein WAV18_32950, partial [Roseiarcus sp.]
WFEARTANGPRGVRKTMIVALARKLLIDLWRFAGSGAQFLELFGGLAQLRSGGSFFSGSRAKPGARAATSQLDWLNSMATINVLSRSRAARDLLGSTGLGEALHRGNHNGDGALVSPSAP